MLEEETWQGMPILGNQTLANTFSLGQSCLWFGTWGLSPLGFVSSIFFFNLLSLTGALGLNEVVNVKFLY